MHGVILLLPQDLAFSCAEFPEIPVGLFLLPVGVPLSGHTAIWCISLSFSSVPEMAFLVVVVSEAVQVMDYVKNAVVQQVVSLSYCS